MPTDDVVAELDAHIHDANNSVDYVIEWRRTLLIGLLQRARDEIVALRRTIRLGPDLPERARIEALEEAARVCEVSAEIMQPDEQRLSDAIAAVKSCAAAIRALKNATPP